MQKTLSSTERGTDGRRPRGRPRAFDRDAALAKATALFWEKGYEATSIADLTEALGIGAPSLYAAFGSKDALFAEALDHYCESNASLVWKGFIEAATAREAALSFLKDSAAVLTGTVKDIPRGCMVTLSLINGEEHDVLSPLVRNSRAQTLLRLEERFELAVREGEIEPNTDVHALARFVQTIQNGMSILARDGVSAAELDEVAELGILAWDVRTRRCTRPQE